MYLVLLVIGLLMSAAGLVTIGFGIPINAFSLGNTLIIAGTTALACGLVLIGLAVAVRQLRRIADALNVRPMPMPTPRPNRPAEASEAAMPPPPPARSMPLPTRAAMPKPPEPPMPRAPEPSMSRPPEPPYPAVEPHAPDAPAEATGPLNWLRPKNKSAEPPMVEEDEVPLSPLPPRAPPRLPLPSMPATSSAPSIEPKIWLPNRGDGPGEAKPAPRSDSIARVAPASERKEPEKESGLFDVVWPDVKNAPSLSSEPKTSERPTQGPPPPREEPVAEKQPEPAPAERPPAILKSGVIDGMAYTLYADGAIEAELPQGTVKFASVDALRAHLEKHG